MCKKFNCIKCFLKHNKNIGQENKNIKQEILNNNCYNKSDVDKVLLGLAMSIT